MQPAGLRGLLRIETAAIVVDADLHARPAGLEAKAYPGGAGVLANVGQRFLDDARDLHARVGAQIVEGNAVEDQLGL